MEAALRSVYEIVSGKTLESLDFYDVRGMEGVKEATVNIDGLEVGVAVAHSLGNARKILDQIKEGNSKCHFMRSWPVRGMHRWRRATYTRRSGY